MARISTECENVPTYEFSKQEIEVLDAAYKVWIEWKEDKRRCLWLYGKPNCGKTTWLDLFGSIFVSSKLDIGDSKFQNA